MDVLAEVRPAAARGAPLRLERVYLRHPLRASIEEFIAVRYRQAYGARVTHFHPYLLGVRDAIGGWRAGAGYAPALTGALFVEQYLDQRVEQTLAAVLGRPVARSDIVEVGNLAAVTAGMGRVLVPRLAQHLHRLGYRWVVFTATRALRNSFLRLGLRPLRLASADPARLTDRGASWGEYYAHDPAVMAGRIALGMHADACA